MRPVAVIMPVRNEEDSVDETIAAVVASTRMPDEIIVADGMSTDRTVEKVLAWRARGVNITVVPNPEIYPGSGRNAGARATNCEILVFCDFGNLVERDWVAAMVAPFEADADVAFVTGLYFTHAKNEFERCVASINYPKLQAFERATPEERRTSMAPVAAGGSVACTRECWERAGGFPGWLRTAEDKLFARKLARLGVGRALAWDAAVRHHMRPNAGAIYRQYFLYGRGDGQTRYFSPVLLKLLAVHGGLLGLVALAPVSAAFPAAALVVLALYVHLAGIRKVMRHDGGLRWPARLLHAPRILLARDLGTIAGSIAGWLDWMLRRDYRDKFWAYYGPRSDGPRALGRRIGDALQAAMAGLFPSLFHRRAEAAPPHAPSRLRYGRYPLAAAATAAFGAVALMLVAGPSSLEIVGPIDRVVDGDTLSVQGVVIDLHGIDAPEPAQNCGDSGEAWACGEAARAELERLAAGKRVVCQAMDKNGGGRTVARCWTGSTDLAAAMVEEGLALAERRSSSAYVEEEEGAESARRGIWTGPFTPPWDWRRSNGR